jgi:hypothetical protein
MSAHVLAPPTFVPTMWDEVAIRRMLALWWEDVRTGRFGACCCCAACRR